MLAEDNSRGGLLMQNLLWSQPFGRVAADRIEQERIGGRPEPDGVGGTAYRIEIVLLVPPIPFQTLRVDRMAALKG